ncbi:MAG: phospho-N-acetylmuramoyl-pentapeptide-transferase [Firmicutes bacterium]|nr:phospho-N-acetylmuramoyl-pentapeptide-transferase [Bacillota bacterium]
MTAIIISVLISFGISIVIGPFLIPALRRLNFGQSILEIGPRWHAKKSGTPTMGGFIFIIAVTVTVIFFIKDHKAVVLLLTSLGFGLIGFIDDFIKVVLKRNLGLTAIQKFMAQTVAAVIFVAYTYYANLVDGEILIPFSSFVVELEWWLYIPFAVLVILATVNSVNLTDGLDGLATGITIVVSVFFTIAAFAFKDIPAALFTAAITGGCVGFLLFNAYPAKVFMGDTGSLFLGGAISVAAIVLKLPLMLIIVGGVYLIETLSVIIQVTSFKLTGKRVFKMSPLHHHFEMTGWKETHIVALFVLATIVLSLIGFSGMMACVGYL